MKKTLKIPGLWYRDSSGAVKINQDDIAYCYHSNDITRIVYAGGRHVCVQVPLKKIEDKLDRKNFFRCHRNYLVNLRHVEERFQDNDTLRFSPRQIVPVARRRRQQLIVRLGKINAGNDVSA